MQEIDLRRIKNRVNEIDKEYYSEMTIYVPIGKEKDGIWIDTFPLKDKSKDGTVFGITGIPSNLRCRMMFDCMLLRDEGGTSYANVEVIIPCASEMIGLIIGKPVTLDSSIKVTLETWKALFQYCMIYKGTMQNSPIQFSLSSADAASRYFDRFEEWLKWVMEGSTDLEKQERIIQQILGWRWTNDIWNPDSSLQLSLTQERLGTRPNDAWWIGDLQMFENATAIGFLPIPAMLSIDNDVQPTDAMENTNGMMLFFENIASKNDAQYLAGTLTAYIPRDFPQWQKRSSMTPEIMNPDFIYRGIQEGEKLDQSTINGFFNRVTNTIQGVYAKTASMASVVTSFFTIVKKLADENRKRREEILALQDFNPIGCIVQFVGEMDKDQLDYYRLCDGRPIGYSANDKRMGDFYLINKLMWQMAKAQNPDDESLKELDLERIYNVPDMRGFFLVGARPSEVETATIDNIGGGKRNIELCERDGKYMHKLTINELPKHKHQSGQQWYSNGDSGGNNPYCANSYTGFDIYDEDGTMVDSDMPHNNVPPYFAINYYIRVKV